MAQKLEISLNFDKVLSSLYEEEENFDINPDLYAIKHFDAIKSQVDLYYNTKNLEDSTIQDSYLKIINKIDELWAERVENCANNFEQFQKRLKKILQDSSEITKYCQQKEFLVKIHKIRKESIELRREIFKRNLIFIDKLGKKDIGSLIVIEPFCLDDSQIKIIKY